jgi:hypothetical protein
MESVMLFALMQHVTLMVMIVINVRKQDALKDLMEMDNATKNVTSKNAILIQEIVLLIAIKDAQLI